MKYIILPTLSLLFSLSGFAQGRAKNIDNQDTATVITDTVKNKKGEILNEVIITANKQNKPVSAIRSGLKPMDIPQSIQIIGNDVIEQQQSIRLSDVIKNVNGVYVGSARGGSQESFWSRGYDMSANNMFKNGFRLNSGVMPEVSSLEKVEVLKGSSALLFGNVTPGGILNMVTKTPSFKSGGEVSMQMGSYSFYKPTVDFYGPLSDVVAYRFTGSYENSESFRDIVKRERYYINPSFLFKVSNKTNITLQGDYLHDDWTPDFGTGAIGKEISDVPRSKYLGALWSNGTTQQTTISALVNHNFNDNWKFNFNTSFQNFDRVSKGTERISIDTKIKDYVHGDWNRPLGQNKSQEQIIAEQFSLQGTFYTGRVKHELFTGVDLENSFAQAYTYAFSPATYDKVNIFNFTYDQQRMDIPVGDVTKIVKTDTNRFGIYFQDLISITEQFKVLAGLRWSWQEAKAETQQLNTKTKQLELLPEVAPLTDQAFSPKIGLVYQPTKDMSLFASYSTSFTPNTGVTYNNTPLDPSIIDQYEIGIKKDFWRGALSTNVTLYQIDNDNLVQTAEFNLDGSINTNTNLKVLSGGTRSKGVEIDITARPIEGLSIIAGYSYNDMRYTKTSGKAGSFIEGDRLARTPANTANLSFFYKLPTGALKGVTFGAIANYIGKRTGGWNSQYVEVADPNNPNAKILAINDREIPLTGYTTIDVSAGYEWNKFAILCKLSNITNELNYTVHENYSVNPIAPRQVMTSLRYKF
ncbi:TonB-dependent siderophore receptor [Flavobacterium sp. ALJ2]|uniref:TonB-dependent siderophore receptor n=1 Tax=Flavobacterium sp. ALJ2 TaxID=2786960 RepID=UPI00189D0E1E|nr:TonB-dependent siderophore receptor [Flavobacterium sp. ALJ2]MBF7090169.1 TonB-dependent siderophore receptor [Flavobacterium sp. ALJ2]